MGRELILKRIKLSSYQHASIWSHPVLIPVSRSYSKLEGRLLTRSSPLRHWCIAAPVRLACLIHAASVRSEPGSNSPKKLFSSLTLQFVIFFRKEDLWLFWFCTIVQIYCFFTTTFQVLFKTFKIWLGLIARFNFSRNTQTKIKTHLQRKPIYFHQGFRYLQHLPVLQDAFPPSAIFRPIVTSNLLFANSCRSWCCLMYHQSRICQTLFSKKFKKIMKFSMRYR